MNLLFISEFGEGLPLALHTMRGDTSIKLFVEKGNVGEGLVEISEDVIKDSKWADLVAITSPKLCKYHKDVSKWCPTIGGSRFEEQFNLDQSIWKSLYKLGGGLLPFRPPSKTLPTILIGAWYGRGDWRLPAVVGYVETGLFPGGKGLEVEGVGVSVTSDMNRKLFSLLLKPFGQSLKRKEYSGFMTMSAIFDGETLSPTQALLGLDSYLIPSMREITNTSLLNTLKKLISKHETSSKLEARYGVSIMISVPPFPYDKNVNEVPIEGYNSKNAKHLWLLDVNKLNGRVRCAGLRGAIGYATACGVSVREARRRATRTIERLDIPQVQYRNDVGKDFNSLISRVDEKYHFLSSYQSII